MFWKRKPEPRELSYGSPWVERNADMTRLSEPVYDHDAYSDERPASYGYQPNDQTVYPGLEPDWLGQFPKVVGGGLEMVEPAVGTDRVYAVEIIDGSGSQIVYTDDNPIITVREL